MNKALNIVSVCLLTLLFGGPSFALTRTELLPEERQLDARVSNLQAGWNNLKKSSMGRLWTDPQFQDFLGNPEPEVWTDFLFEGEDDAVRDMLMEQFRMLQGEILVALCAESDDPYLVVAMSAEDFQRSLELDDKLAKLEDEPFSIVRGTFQDVEIIQHIEDAGTEMESSSWQAHLNHTLVLGPSREWVEKSIVRLKKEAIEEPEGIPSFDLNVPLARLIQELIDEAGDTGTDEVDPALMLGALGILGIEQFTMHAELKEDELVIDNRLASTSLDKGVFTLLDMEPVELPTVSFVPENIALLEVGRLDLLRFWQEIPAVLTQAVPDVKPQFDLLLGMVRQQIGIDLEHDLLAHLGTRYLGYSTYENDALVNVLALELRDSQAFRQGLEAVLNTPALKPQIDLVLDTVDFLDHRLYVSKETETDDAFAFAVAGDYLLYGAPEGLRQVIRSLTSESAANTRFEQSELVQELRRLVPQTAFAYSAVDWEKNMAFLIRELTDPFTAEILVQEWATSGAPIPPPDFGKIPPTDHLASFFNKSFVYVEKTNRGLHQKIIIRY